MYELLVPGGPIDEQNGSTVWKSKRPRSRGERGLRGGAEAAGLENAAREEEEAAIS